MLRSAVLTAAAVFAVQFVGPHTSSRPGNVLLARGRTEPVLAVDPRNPAFVFAGSNTNYSAPVGNTLPDGVFVSQDGGRSFASGTGPVRYPYTTQADPSVGIGRTGTLFFAFLGETPSYCSGGRSAVMVTVSTDRGRSFRTPVVVDSNSADDKPLLAVSDASGRFAHLFVTWTRWHTSGSRSWSDIWYSQSVDGGATFSPARMLYTSSLDNFGSLPVMGPNHRIFVFWSVFPDGSLTAPIQTQIVMARSTDGGRTFGRPSRVAGPFRAVPHMATPGYLRNLTAPAVVAAGKSLYLSWAQASHVHADGSVDADIEIRKSTDGGQGWSRPFRVNDVRRGDRFMPAVASLGGGRIGVAFYDRRTSNSLDLVASLVSLAGHPKRGINVRVNERTSPINDIYYIKPGSTCFSPGRFFGDYIGAAACGSDTLCTVWADTQLHVWSETDVWFARVDLAPTARKAANRHAAAGRPSDTLDGDCRLC